MAYDAKVYKILVASPSDVTNERKAIPEVIGAWNATHSDDYRVVLLPVMWETHSTPEMGGRPQAILNKQIVSSCDLLIGTFWTRIGTHTGVTNSGTVEEIEEFRNAGKPILLYFSSVPVVPESIDTDQYNSLLSFRQKCQRDGLIDNYDSIIQLREKLGRHLTTIVRKIHGDPSFNPSNIDEDIRSVRAIENQLTGLIVSREVDWKTERDSQPTSVEEAKNILRQFVSELIKFRPVMLNLVNQSVLKSIDDKISELKRLKEHPMVLDGGKSYKAFWDIGDQIFSELHIILNNLAYEPSIQEKSQTTGGLEHEKVQILKRLAAAEESRKSEMEDSEISTDIELSLMETRYHLGVLEKEKYVYASYAFNQPVLYSLDHNGREFLIKHKLL